jgi:hypothetical protein
MVTGILIQKSGSYWVARANARWSVTSPTAHGIVRILQIIAEDEELDYSA